MPGNLLAALSGGRFGPIPRTLAHPNFGTYIAGNAVSLIGTWMQRIGVGWLAWELSGSGAVLGMVAFADLFPSVVIGPFGGALADRVSRLRVIQVAQSLIMLQAVTLFALTASGLITVELLIALVAFSGVVIGFNQPARLALIPSLVPRAHLGTAVAINSIVFNTARFIGPALAGVTIVWLGIAAVFLLNALSFVAFLLALTRVRLDPASVPATRPAPVLRAVLDGVRYTSRHPGIGPMLLLHAIIAVCARPFVELLPGFADAVFDRGAGGLAILSSSVGIGAITGGLWLAQRRADAGLTRMALLNAALVGVTILLFALSDGFWMAVALVTIAGFGMVTSGVGTQTVLQTAVDEGMRGRVMSLFGLIFRGGPALGALVMGAASELVGLPAPLAAGAALALLAWLWIWRLRRRIALALNEGAGARPRRLPAAESGAGGT